MKKKETKEFNAYTYAGKFEELSLEVVLFKEDIKIKNVIGKDTTQETRRECKLFCVNPLNQ